MPGLSSSRPTRFCGPTFSEMLVLGLTLLTMTRIQSSTNIERGRKSQLPKQIIVKEGLDSTSSAKSKNWHFIF